MTANPILDQIQAAAAEVHQHLDVTPGAPKYQNPRGWVDQTITEFMTAVYGESGRACVHLDNPRPAFGELSRPGVVVCSDCFNRVHRAPDTCDRCGTREGLISSNTVTVGPFAILFGLCPPCVELSQMEQR
ncbi:hypothetical protein ACOZ38_25395 [Sphaerisporangium viridialbum]|uniref:hypothetical protein n=1 Tax=Sphaerisporangium viridialbum TaxID=46189 RepID=UPI003C7321C1